MRIRRIHQFAAGFNPGDAISNDMIHLQDQLRKWKLGGEIFAENIGYSRPVLSKRYLNYRHRDGDLILYHHSIHSSVSSYVLGLEAPKFLIYHNVTPYYFLERYDLKLSYYLRRGREELREMKDFFSKSFAVSEYNRRELEEFGYESVKLLPILYNFPSEMPQREKHTGPHRIIFVGRIVPNKKQDDLIRFAKVYRDMFGGDFRLYLVGYCSRELYSYKEELERMIDFYNLHQEVHFTNFVSDAELESYYKSADLFLSMSEHEGFCVPVLESMYYDIPVVAFDGGAVSETMDGAGILFHQKNFSVLAALVHQILSDQDFRERIVRGQRRRLKQYRQMNVMTELEAALGNYI